MPRAASSVPPVAPSRRVRRKAPAAPVGPPFGCPVDRLKIGAFDYRLIFAAEVVHEGEVVDALHDPGRHEITFSCALNRRQLADRALHEVNHAVWYLGNMDDARDEESVCARHASTMTAIEHDNLAFFRWRLSLLEP